MLALAVVLLIAVVLAFVFGVLWLILGHPILGAFFAILIIGAVIVILALAVKRLLRFLRDSMY